MTHEWNHLGQPVGRALPGWTPPPAPPREPLVGRSCRGAFALGYRRYGWKCDALNAPSRAAAERLGLTFEGIFRQAAVSKGRNRDTAWYAAVDREWPALRQPFVSAGSTPTAAGSAPACARWANDRSVTGAVLLGDAHARDHPAPLLGVAVRREDPPAPRVEGPVVAVRRDSPGDAEA